PMHPSAEEVEEVRLAEEEGLTEQQLGLRQVEERLLRDHIHRLVKVRPRSDLICALASHVLSFILLIISNTPCSLRLYGSCLTRFAFKTSDINIDVTYPSTVSLPLLLHMFGVFVQHEQVRHLSLYFLCSDDATRSPYPGAGNPQKPTGLICKVSAGNDVACLTTNHLAALAKLEPRLVPLVLAFRYWARVEGFDVKRVDEYHLTGIFLDMFVKWEHRPPSSTEGRGENRNEAKAEGGSKPEQKKSDDAHHAEGLSRLTLDVGKGVSLGQLWLELLRFYTLEFALEEYIISIRLKELLSRDAKNWPRRRLAIEGKEELSHTTPHSGREESQEFTFHLFPDPFASKRNVARSLNSQMVFEYIQERFRTTYKYFACPQKRGAGGGHQRKKTTRGQGVKLDEAEGNRDGDNKTGETSQRGVLVSKEDGESDSDDDDDGSDLSGRSGEKSLDAGIMDIVLNDGGKPSSSPNGLLGSEEEEQEEEDRDRPAASDDLHYVFDKMIFTGGKGWNLFFQPPTVVCSICKRDGHLKDECPEDFKKIELKPLPPMNDRFRNILDGLCRFCYCAYNAAFIPLHIYTSFLSSDVKLVSLKIIPFSNSAWTSGRCVDLSRLLDLDICMTLEGHETAEKLNCKEIIEGLAKVLKKHAVPGIHNEGLRKESVGELWLGLLRFYTEEFDFKEHVISIRQQKRLTTFEKQWTSKCIAIEGARAALLQLHLLPKCLLTNILIKFSEYFFDSKVLTDGELAPNDRCCRICGKIGHYMKDCPKRRRLVKKKENEKDEDTKEEDREPKDRRCFLCGDMGHVRRDCPENRHLKQRNAGAPIPHMVRSVANSQSIPIPQAAADSPGRTRQPSECVSSLVTPQTVSFPVKKRRNCRFCQSLDVC
ncbi:hypothetical protein XENOCAPTIV_005312, partial [Xenoophorus captivus]